ncbi:MAG: sialate O-acetylesterase [Culturomica sp.]|jgi:sialate O-acetylesterase|nr:sialate O-acetylesterase [Culturomica sp.]
MRQIFLIIVIFLFSLKPSEAEVKLPAMVGDGMVLQREQQVKIWGTADPNESIKVTFLKKDYYTIANLKGMWEIELPPMKAGGPYTMKINELEIKDILLGDVWLCSGQSNMELQVYRVMDLYADEVQSYTNKFIRHIKLNLAYNFHGPQRDVKTSVWKELTPENALNFSAVAYFFAKDLYEKYKVPIGLLNSSVGGSPAQAWISAEGLKEFPEYISEMEMCKSDKYVNDVRTTDNEARNRWHAVMNMFDPGLKGEWIRPDLNDSDWKTVDLFDRSWAWDVTSPINGTFWFRKTVNISAEQSGKPALLRMGYIIDADSVFVNGVFVGTTAYQYPPRKYRVPANLLKEGENVITVRLISYSGKAGFIHDKPYKIVFDNGEIDLKGKWKFKEGVQMPTSQGETFFNYKATGLYNSMIAPIANYVIKGVIWYQGEANAWKYNQYFGLMSSLIDNWRNLWEKPQLPFLMVQLASYMEPSQYPTDSHWANLRYAQFELSQKVSNTGLAVAIDLGEWNDIHPLNKKDVSKRLALQAQKVAYGDKKVVSDGPIYESMKIDGNRIILSFREGTNKLEKSDNLNGFAIAGKDGRYLWAKAKTEGNTVVVWNDEIPNPANVRYAWENFPESVNLKNTDGLPASPFRTY